MLSDLLHRLRAVLRRKTIESELERELEFHIQRQAEKHVQSGMNPDEAARRARLEFGGMDQVKEQYRESLGVTFLDTIVKDIRYSVRTMSRTPGFTVVAVLSLAIGIGATAAVFSVIDALFLKRLPVTNSERLVLFAPSRPDLRVFMPYLPREDKGFGHTTSYREFEALRERTTVFAGSFVASGGSRGFRLSVGSDAASFSEEVQDVKLQRVSHGFFSTLGVAPVLGRTFFEAEDRLGEPMAAVISHSFWDRRFGRDPMVIGKQVVVTDFRNIKTPATIIGVVQPDFAGTTVGVNVDVWMPLQGRINPQPPTLLGWWGGYEMMARLRPGVSLQQAQAEVDRVYGRLLEEWRDEYGARWTATQAGQFMEQRFRLESGAWGWSPLRAEFKQRLTVLMSSVGSVLLVACINIAAFLLARGSFRQREFAVRRAVGSGRARLIRQLLTESVALAAIGGVIGLFVAHWGLRLLLGYAPALTGLSVNLDIRLVGFAAVLTLLSAVLFGLVPAVRATRPDLNPTLKSGRNNFATERPHLALNQVLVASQIAMSLVLLVAAGLFVRTLQNLRALDPGFDKREIVLVALNRPVKMARLMHILDRIEGTPVVESSTAWAYGMLGEGGMSIGPIHVNGHVPEPNEDLTAAATYVGPRFFETAGISLIAGRGFTPEDSLGSRVAVVSAAMARHYFGNENPIGRRFLNNGPDPRAKGTEIIGVAEDTKYASLRDGARRAFYLPFPNNYQTDQFAVRTRADAATVADVIAPAIQDVDPQLQISSIQTMNDLVERSLFAESSMAQIASIFSVLALTLACIGLYGTLSYAVAQRTNEIGIRMALGARVYDVIAMLALQTSWMVGIGLAAGLLGTLALMQMISSFLFGLTSNDPATVVVAALVLIAAAAVAAYLPVRRAVRVDPMVALRHE